MKNFPRNLSFLILSVFVLLNGACSEKRSKTLVIGASAVPHKVILEAIKRDYEQKGFQLDIKEFADYITPNTAALAGSIDANYSQNIPYLKSNPAWQNLVPVFGVHLEPFGLYSKKYRTAESIPDGATISVPNDPTNSGRAYLLLESRGLIKLESDTGLKATDLNIIENPHNFKFKAIEAERIPLTLDDVDAACINGNFALQVGFNPVKDALVIEDASSPYVNIVVVKQGFENDPRIIALQEVMLTPRTKDFILDTWSDGSIIPVF